LKYLFKKMEKPEFLKNFKRNILLKDYTTFKIGGPAKYFFIADNEKNLIDVLKYSKKDNLPFFILGGGSNLLVSDKGFDGLVIKVQFSDFKIKNSEIYAQGGAELSKIVESASKEGLEGIEWIVGIPKVTIGGAIRNNAGAFGSCMGDIIKSVEVFDILYSQTKTICREDCKFDYKETVFKQNKNLVVLSCLLKLKKGNKKEIKNRISYFLDYRKKNHPMDYPSAGCVFKNPPGMRAADLIERVGLKGKRLGGAEISKKHANFIINFKKAKASDVLELINLAKERVKNKFGIILEEEIQYLGF